MRGENLEGYYKNPPVPKDADSIVNVSGGIECFASLWWAKENGLNPVALHLYDNPCLLYTSPSPRDGLLSRMPSSA